MDDLPLTAGKITRIFGAAIEINLDRKILAGGDSADSDVVWIDLNLLR